MFTTSNDPMIFNNESTSSRHTAGMSPEDQRMRLFFLEEARLLCPATHVNCSEYSKIHAVYKRLNRMERLFTLMYQHNWGQLLPDAQKALNFYLLEGYVPKKERPRLIELLTREMDFTIKFIQFNDFITFMMQHYTSQVKQLERLMNLYYKPETVESFPETGHTEE